MNFKFGQDIHKVHPNKIPLQIWKKRERGRIHGLPKLVRERSALSDPYCQSTWNSVCLSVCLSVRNFEVKYLGNQRS